MRCLTDQPLRLRFTPKGVIHAGSRIEYGGFTRYRQGIEEKVPRQKVVRIACRWRDPKDHMERYIISNKEIITCKNCMKAMGLDETPLAADRFVVHRKDTGEFHKNTSTRCSGWCKELTDAFFYKREHTARDKCKVLRYQTEDGRLLKYAEWQEAGRPKIKYKRILDPNLEIKKVKIRLE